MKAASSNTTRTLVAALLLLSCVALWGLAGAAGAADTPQGATASARASASATAGGTTQEPEKATAPLVDATAQAKATATASSGGTTTLQVKEEPKKVEQPKPTADVKRNPDAEAAWWAYVNKCANNRYDPKVTSPGECATLSGKLCSRKDVKCSAKGTEILDPSGSGVKIATGDDVQQKLCYLNGPCAQA